MVDIVQLLNTSRERSKMMSIEKPFPGQALVVAMKRAYKEGLGPVV